MAPSDMQAQHLAAERVRIRARDRQPLARAAAEPAGRLEQARGLELAAAQVALQRHGRVPGIGALGIEARIPKTVTTRDLQAIARRKEIVLFVHGYRDSFEDAALIEKRLLGAAGVGTLGIVDFDVVDYTNLQRQIIHSTADVGRKKLDSAADRMHEIQSGQQVSFRVNGYAAQDFAGRIRLVTTDTTDPGAPFELVHQLREYLRSWARYSDWCDARGVVAV